MFNSTRYLLLAIKCLLFLNYFCYFEKNNIYRINFSISSIANFYCCRVGLWSLARYNLYSFIWAVLCTFCYIYILYECFYWRILVEGGEQVLPVFKKIMLSKTEKSKAAFSLSPSKATKKIHQTSNTKPNACVYLTNFYRQFCLKASICLQSKQYSNKIINQEPKKGIL